ncbi:hypothetical protein SAMN02745164_00570 [Marinitoga hydrogenitolerans DSM 16785]|uniref:Uncharacterized protein n=1 Tax=Marinitoga hydrogenitolerans (strain DSM 16785 / JCM 12826 / AT1271) TaxID=1122195 RepID=A0A1M4TZT7_MARH1|nr:hypothetical protein [Marinitoga hydrogenitolerans]SHE49968.1 hypothetical protein SAMN02745164_00570 [Marinitoga hydrogenitolerans DSM 16785]
MNNGEFKKEERLEISMPRNEKTDNKKNNQSSGRNNNFLFLVLLINITVLGVLIYLILNQSSFKMSMEKNIEEIQNKVNKLDGLNNNLEKLNNNFQILDIINSNTRQIPDVLMVLEENKKILKNIDINRINELFEKPNSPSVNASEININFSKEINELSEKLKTDLETILNEKMENILDNLKKDYNESLKLDELSSKIDNMLKNMQDINKALLEFKSKENEILQNENLTKEIKAILLNTELLIKSSNDTIQVINKKYESLDIKISSLNDRLDKLERYNEQYNNNFVNIENTLRNIEKKWISVEKNFYNIQNQYYEKIEHIINKNNILFLMNKLNDYMDSSDFKLIEMVNLYKDIVSKYSLFSDDSEVKRIFNELSKDVYNKFFSIIENEKIYLKSTGYSENIKKDIKYLNYVFSKFPKMDEKEYKQIKESLEELKKLEKEKMSEYNNRAINEINDYLSLFSKKVVLQEEIIYNFKSKILKINPELLDDKVKKRYFEVVERTKEILKDKYVW